MTTPGHPNIMAAADTPEIIRAMSIMLAPGQVTEVRALEATTAQDRYPQIYSGYFNNASDLAREVKRLQKATGIYFTPNPVDPSLLARSVNKLRPPKKEPTTTDGNIIRRRWLLVDCDPARPAGISSSEAEHAAALDRARLVRDELTAAGWPEPIYASSGKGAHLNYAVDLPAKDDGIVERVLKELSHRFTDDAVKIDESVANPARIWKLYGTVACKGDAGGAAYGRPHRLSHIIDAPDVMEVVTVEQLKAFAPVLPASTPPAQAQRHTPATNRKTFELAEWIRRHGIQVDGPTDAGSGAIKYVFPVCPWNPEHTNRSAFIMQLSRGGISAGCHHESCKGKSWSDLRALFDGPRPARTALTAKPADRHTAKQERTKAESPSLDENYEYHALTESENGRILAKLIRSRARFNVTSGKWMFHDGKRFTQDDTGFVERYAKAVARKTSQLMLAPPPDATDKEAYQFFKSTSKASGIQAMMRLAQTEPGISARMVDFDRDPFLFNTLDGTVDLRTGKIRAHSETDLITKLAPVNFNGAADCPLWKSFLNRAMAGNETMIAYQRRLMGYALSADASVQELWFFYGSGANGKSVFLDTISGMMGDYSGEAAPSLLTASANEGHPTEIADLAGKRLVFASETEEGARLRVQLVKRLTGDAVLKARFMRQDFFEFPRTHKLIVVTNNVPTIRETSNAIWRRVRIVPFVVTIPPAEQDPQLLVKLRAEWPGILNWCIAGCLDWQRNGMQTPDEVMIATDGYRQDQDVLAEYIAERCILAEDACVRPTELYADYATWSKAIGDHQPLDRTSFDSRLRNVSGVREGTVRIDGKPTRAIKGIELKNVENEYRRSSSSLSEDDL